MGSGVRVVCAGETAGTRLNTRGQIHTLIHTYTLTYDSSTAEGDGKERILFLYLKLKEQNQNGWKGKNENFLEYAGYGSNFEHTGPTISISGSVGSPTI